MDYSAYNMSPLQRQLAARQLFSPLRYQGQPQQGGIGLNQGLGLAKQIGTGMKAAKGGFDAAGNFVGNSTVTGAGTAAGNLLGKVVPLAGAGMGIYGLLTQNGIGHNLMNGASTGASVGTMIMPGIGTLAGAGIGALAGGIKSLFNIGKPSQEELAGRSANTDAVSKLVALATPEQRAQAQQSVGHGWDNANDPLSIIVMRDALTKSGMDPKMADQQAQAWKRGLWNSEKQGGQAVGQAFSPIQQFFYSGKSPSQPNPSNTGQPGYRP